MTTFIWPTDVKRITSKFRPPHRPGHHGLDIAQAGTHHIKAAAAGKVSRSYRSDSYGECIMIEHTINGVTWETVYAHMRTGSRKVGVGQSVKQGQVIGTMGNTGHSTSQHLHFELHKNGRWNINKTNAVNPLDYLEKNLYPSKVSKWKKVTGKWTGQTLRKGEYGPPVKQMQKMLADNDPPFYPEKGAKDDGVDSYFGDNTENAVERYQKVAGLTVDGLPGKEVYNSLTGKKKKPSYVGKRVESKVNGDLRFYSKPSWDTKNQAGLLKKGYGFPTIVSKVKVGNGHQYKVKNSKGKVYYITANSKYVKVV